MNYSEFLEQIKELEFKELREDQPEYMEFVLATNHLNRLSSILESYYGAVYASPEEQPSKQAQKYADPYGGIRKGQTLYYLKSGEIFRCALLWPWGDGKATTIKIIQGENKSTGTRTESVAEDNQTVAHGGATLRGMDVAYTCLRLPVRCTPAGQGSSQAN